MLSSDQQTEISKTAREFFGNPEIDVEGWLKDAVSCWVNDGKAASFAPFQSYFPSDQPDAESLAWVGASFPATKTVRDSLSLKGKFRKAIVSILGYPDLYLSDLRAWRMVLEVAQNMALSEVTQTLTALVNEDRFHKAGNDEGHSLFLAAFKAVEHFGVTPDVIGFWKASLVHIEKYSSLSTQLLENLVRSKPDKWNEYLTDGQMSTALTKFYNDLKDPASPKKIPDVFIWLKQNISETISDQPYLEGARRVIRSNVDFLLDLKRLKKLDSVREPSSTDRTPPETGAAHQGHHPLERSPPKILTVPQNLRASAGLINRMVS